MIKNDLIDIAEEISEFGYSATKFACSYFYKVSNLEALKESKDSFMVSRFAYRLESIALEHNKIPENIKQHFYKNLIHNKQNVNYLYELIEKTRTTTFELHARILARLSVHLIRNNNLSYSEVTLLTSIDSLNDLDLKNLYTNFYSNIRIDKNNKANTGVYVYKGTEDRYTFKKCLSLGLFERLNKHNFFSGMKEEPIEIPENTFYDKVIINNLTYTLFNILDDIILKEDII